MCYSKLRLEFSNKTFRDLLKNKLGYICASCDSSENIVPLCIECHEKAHDKKSFKRKKG